MAKTYKSKVDNWLIFVILVAIFISMSPLIYAGFSIAILYIDIAISAFILSELFGIRYIIDGKQLIVKSGFMFSQKFFIDDIRSIKATRTLLSAPAASLDRLEISFNKTSVIISPKDKTDFINSIKEACAHDINIFL